VFEKEINKSLAKFGDTYSNFFYFRLFDTKSFRLLSENIFAIRQPSDFVAVFKGRIYFLELKSSHSPVSFSYRYIRTHQLESLLKAEKAGAKSYFVINDRSKVRHFKAYAIRPSVLASEMALATRKSITWERLKELSMEIPRTKNQLWSLDRLLDIYHM